MKVLYDEQAYKELSKDEVVDRKMKVSSAPSGRLDALKRQHSMQFDKTMDLNRAQKLWMLLDDPSFSSASFYYANFSMLIILISTISFCLESEFNCLNVDLHPHLLNYTLPSGQLACDEWEKTWWWFECLAVVFFTAELALRFTACPGKGKFMKDFANWIDLLAILPFYLEQVLHTAHSAHRAFCTACTSAPLHPARLHLCALCARHPPPSPRAGRGRCALRLLSLPRNPAGALCTSPPAPHAPYAPCAPRYPRHRCTRAPMRTCTHSSCAPPAPLLQVRVFRVFKMGKSFAGLQLMVSALRASRQARWAPSAPSPALSSPPLAPSAPSAPSARLPRAPSPPPLCTSARPRLDSAPLHLCRCTAPPYARTPCTHPNQVFGILGFLVGIAMIVFSSGVFYLEVPTTKACIAEAEVTDR